MQSLFGGLRSIYLVLSLFLFSVITTSAHAQLGDLVAEYPGLNASKLVYDASRNRAYASITTQNEIAVLDNQTNFLITLIPVGPSPVGLAISNDGKLLYVAHSGMPGIEVVDLNNLQSVNVIATPRPVYDIVAANNNMLFATPATTSNSGIIQIDANIGAVINEFSQGINIYQNGLLALSPDKNTLYFANRGLSPGTLAKFDLTSGFPNLTLQNPFGSLGGNGQDLAVTADGQFVSYVTGGGNNQYDINKMQTSDFFSLGSFVTGPYPSEIEYSPFGEEAFIVHEAGTIDIFDANNFTQVNQIVTPPLLANELMVDGSSKHLYAAFDDAIRVYSALNAITPITSVYFSDPAMQSCFEEQIQQHGWQFTEEVTDFVCASRGVQDIAGIEFFPRLRSLDVSNNNISYLSPAVPLPQTLIGLEINGNQITDSQFIQNMPALQSLAIGDNPLDIYMLSAHLQALPNLAHLSVAGLPIQDIGMLNLMDQFGKPRNMIALDLSRTLLNSTYGIEMFSSLQRLDISDTNIDNINSLISLTQLRDINFANLNLIPFPDLQQVLNNNPNLTSIDLSGIYLQDLNILPLNNPQTGQPLNLMSLKVANTGLKNIDSLANFQQSLAILDVSGNDITSLQALIGFTQLQDINISGNSNIDVYQLTEVIRNNLNITHLSVADIPLMDFGILPLLNQQTGQPYNLVKLDLHNTGISDLFNIGSFVNLEVLDISDNGVYDVQQLFNLTKLRELDLSNNVFGSSFDILPALEQKPNLQKLGLAYLRLEDLGLLPLINQQTGKPLYLTSLNLSHTGLRDINLLNGFTSLEELDLSGNNISQVFSLIDMNRLSKLNLSGNNLINWQDLPPVLNNKPKLTHLGLGDIKIPAINFIPFYDPQTGQPYRLVEVDFSNTGIEIVDELAQFPSLRRVDVSDNKIYDIGTLGLLDKLESLDISNNRIDSLFPISNLYELRELNVAGNTNLDLNSLNILLSQNVMLRDLNVSGLQLVDLQQLPIFNTPQDQFPLRRLDISNTAITNLNPLDQLFRLQELNISDNNIIDLIPIQFLDNLTHLEMRNVGATNLGVLNNKFLLKKLDISNNNLGDLFEVENILRNNPGLQELGLAGVPIQDLFRLPLDASFSNRPYALKSINLSNTGIMDVNRLNEFLGLRQIDISDNALNILLGIDALGNVRDLNVANTGITSLNHFDSYRFLEGLDISGNNSNPNIQFDLSYILPQNQNIKRLGLANLGIVDLVQIQLPAAPSSGLTELNLDNNPLVSLAEFINYPTIERLSLRSIQAGDLSALQNFNDPSWIDLRDNTQFLCIQLNELEAQFGADVIQRPDSCLLSQVPTITLIEPLNPIDVQQGTPVTFIADANDAEDGNLAAQIQWNSNIDGFLGLGGNLSVLLSAGQHTITASVTDSDGAVASVTANVNVIAAPVAYCDSKGNSTWYEWVDSVDFAGQNVITGNNNGYSDNTATEFTVQRGGSYPVTMTPGFRYGAYSENWAAWIDFNGDGTFSTDERVFTGTSVTTLTRTAIIPVTAKVGQTRMRVAMRWGSSPSACGNYSWGETEDFSVNIQ